MAQPGFIFGGNTNLTYDQVKKQREIANELLRANMQTPQNVGEGLSAIGRALAAKAIDKRTSRADAENRKAYEATRDSIFGSLGGFGGGAGGSAPASYAPAPPPGPEAAIADDTMTALGKTPMRPYRDAIASIESAGSGDYGAVGPTNPQLGRALGRYQIMEANIGPWSREVLGREVTPEEFMANPRIQDAIFDGKFGGYVNQFGPEGAAQAWFAGPGGVGKMDRQDVLGTSVGEYTQKFSSALGGGAPAQPQAVQGMANPAVLMALAEVQGNPYASESDKAIAALLMNQTVQAMDPMRALEMERARLEVDQLRNPQAKPTATMQEYEFAKSQGYQGGFTDFKREMAAAGRSTTTVNVGDGAPGLGKLSTDFGYVLDPATGQPKIDPATGLPQAAPVPGSPAALEAQSEQEARARAAAVAASNEQTRSNVVLEATGAIRNALEGGGMFDLPEVGIVGNALKGINQESADVGGMLDTLKGMVVFDRLEKLKAASATGASGLGQVTEREIALLGAQLRALEQNLSKDRILETLNTVESVFGKLSPDAQAYLMGATESLPQGDGGAQPAQARDFSQMSDVDLLSVDVSTLSPAELEAMLRRLEEVGQ